MNRVYSVCKQIDDLLGSVSDSRLLHRGRIVTVAVNYSDESLWQSSLRYGADSLYLLCVRNGHNACDDGNVYVSAVQSVQKIVQYVKNE